MSATTPRTPTQRPSRQVPSLEVGLHVPASRPRPAHEHAAPSPPAMVLPNVVIPGVSHAGAGMLAADLARHPEVCLPDVKRVGHFTPLRYGRPVEAPLEEYERHFTRWSGQRYRVETAPDYFDGGPAMVRHVAESLPGARVVLILRDPSHRLWTSYTDKLARGRLPRAMTFDTYVDRSLTLRANGAERFEGNRHFRTFSSGFYIRFLPAWLETFGRRARVVFTEDLQADPGPHVGALFDWLGLNPAAAGPRFEDVAAAEGYPPPETAAPFNLRLWPVLPRASGPWRSSVRLGSEPARRVPRQAERTRGLVRSRYAEANAELAALLADHGYSGLPGWLTTS